MNSRLSKFCKSAKCPYHEDDFLLCKKNSQLMCIGKKFNEKFLCGFITKAGSIRKAEALIDNPDIDLKIKSFSTIYSYLKYVKPGVKK